MGGILLIALISSMATPMTEAQADPSCSAIINPIHYARCCVITTACDVPLPPVLSPPPGELLP